MSLSQHGVAISHNDQPAVSEVTNIGASGFWLLSNDVEYFVPFADYPIFREATVAQIYDMQQLSPGQFHWPQLDADIEVEALAHPENYPLVFRSNQN